jgi:hypothetical protein
MPSLLHNHPEFIELLRIVADDLKISPVLVEKDYWIMHSLWGLQQMGLTFQLKGGTSLSKGFGIIDRFSEDIDILIEPPPEMNVKTGKNQDKKRAHCESRRKYYDYLADTITIDGIVSVQRDHEFDGDDGKYRQGGIRLRYHNLFADSYLKEGILLEVGFDDVTPNTQCDISSWAYDYAVGKIKLADNRAKAVQCYHPGYTLVEKLQTIARKFNQWQEKRQKPVNFIRHYYDVHCLLKSEAVLGFIGSAEYEAHKEKRFSQKDNPVISTNNAFLLHDPKTRAMLSSAYEASDTLYCKGHPSFDEILETIRAAIENGL